MKLIISIIIISISACSSISKLAIGSDEKTDRVRVIDNSRNPASVAYVSSPSFNYSNVEDRASYNPVEEKPDAFTGSLWNTSGQKTSFFTTNLEKNVGDLLRVKLEPLTKRQLVEEYENLYLKTSTKENRAKYLEYLVKDKEEFSKEDVKKLMFKSATFSDKILEKKKTPKSARRRILATDEITAKVVEITENGSYRIQGVERITVNKRPFRLILGGLIRPSDIDPDDSIASSKLVNTRIKFLRSKRS